jgi:hypothetical protein
MLLAQAGNDDMLLRDCDVREVVAYTLFGLVDKVVRRIEPPAKEKRVKMYSFFTKRLAGDPPWRTTQRLPKVGTDKELDELVKMLKFKKRTHVSTLWREYKKSKGILGQLKISTSVDDLVVAFKNITGQSNIAAKAESSSHKYWHAQPLCF